MARLETPADSGASSNPLRLAPERPAALPEVVPVRRVPHRAGVLESTGPPALVPVGDGAAGPGPDRSGGWLAVASGRIRTVIAAHLGRPLLGRAPRAYSWVIWELRGGQPAALCLRRGRVPDRGSEASARHL